MGVREERLTSFILSSFFEIQDQDFSIDNLDFPCDVSGSERVISRDHDTSVRGICEILESLNSVGLEGAVENEETGEREGRFDLFTRDSSDLSHQNQISAGNIDIKPPKQG